MTPYSLPSARPGPRAPRRAWAAAALSMVLLLTPRLAAGQDEPLSAILEAADAAHAANQWDEAIPLFTRVAQHAEADFETRRRALELLAIMHYAKGAEDQLRSVLAELVALRPEVSRIPDYTPPPVKTLFYKMQIERQQAEPERIPGIHTIAVMDFQNASVDDHERWSHLNVALPHLISNYLEPVTDLKVVDRERIDVLIDEVVRNQDPNLVDREMAVAAGKILGAHTMLFGSYIVHGRNMIITARLDDVETSEILFSEQRVGRHRDFLELVEELAQALAQRINRDLDETTLQLGRTTKSVEAALAYSECEERFRQEKYADAIGRCHAALEHDPTHRLAKHMIQSAEAILSQASLPGGDASSGSGR